MTIKAQYLFNKIFFMLDRSRPIVNTSASLTVYPTMINPEEKNCLITSENASIPVSW